ncbi:acyl-ACP--UDP-N-acetylglucosamine O-acyltransferase [Alienimonas chondri]|nr:acyl-ACP--UDP-N-acetylglucosamine O-acyltransferase [Alienimonas chondri]
MPKPALFDASELRATRPAPRSASVTIHHFSDVHPQAVLGAGTTVGPFCKIGPDVVLGQNNTLDSHVVLDGPCNIGSGNRFWPGSVIGGEPQDKSWNNADTGTIIGDDNQFREGVTVHRGAEKEDGITRIGSRCLLMSNAHVAHNCIVGDDCMLVNGSLLGGHVHLHDGAIISGNSAVHHFATVGTLGFVSGSGKLVRDLPPYMMSAGSDSPRVRTVNLIGMRRAGLSESEIRGVKLAHKLLFRQMKPIAEIRAELEAKFDGVAPPAIEKLLSFVETQSGGRNGRGRDGKPIPYEPAVVNPIRRAA